MKMRKTVKKLGAALCLYALTQVTANAATINIFTNESAWQAAVDSYITEDFEDQDLQTPLQTISTEGTISGGVFNDVINDGPLTSTSFSFNPGVYGVGGTWDLAGPSGPGTGITVTTTAGTHFIGEIVPSTDGFWGFTIDETIQTVNLSEGSCIGNDCLSGAIESYTLDNLHMALTLVPVPAAVWLFGSGLIGLGCIARRKKAA